MCLSALLSELDGKDDIDDVRLISVFKVDDIFILWQISEGCFR